MLEERTLVFEKDFESFVDFYQTSNYEIFKETIELLKIIKEKHKASLIITAKINGLVFSSELVYDLSTYEELRNILINYFEKIEDYESCETIKKLNIN